MVPSIGRRFESLDHYSQSAEAYEMFLDDHMQYTCGKFETGIEDINQAQTNKFEFIANLAREHLGSLDGLDHLDIGCGWGGMGAYFSEHFGINSTGNTNCFDQKIYAERRYKSKIIYGDFSILRDTPRTFDLITIVGMMEHLTPRRRSQLLRIARTRLKRTGVIYVQCIAKPSIWIGGDAYRFAQKVVFPGHYLETREQTNQRLANAGFIILNEFEHGKDYGLTASRWVANIQHHEDALVHELGSRQYRTYLGYLAFASKMFATGRGTLLRYMIKPEP